MLQGPDCAGGTSRSRWGSGLPSSAEGPGNQQRPLGPSAGICRGGWKSRLGQWSAKRGYEAVSTCHSPSISVVLLAVPRRVLVCPEGQAGHCPHLQGTGCGGAADHSCPGAPAVDRVLSRVLRAQGPSPAAGQGSSKWNILDSASWSCWTSC